MTTPGETDPAPTIDPNATEQAPKATEQATTRAGEPPTASADSGGSVDETLAAPSLPNRGAEDAKRDNFALETGDRLDDFEVIEVLGRGAFGVVYLARQVSLDRRVALKVTANQGSEGRTMARLEHAHIVQVFSESVDDTGRSRLLCMQLVPGASLEAVIKALKAISLTDGAWTGADYLAVIDERSRVRESFDPSALRDREMLADSGEVETAAWVGARLAEAVGFAHASGVLHRDIKPANVLINQYGRPLLADFNIAGSSEQDASGGQDETFGGTLAFMAPEHLDAFDIASDATSVDVDARSDLYSLGIVVHELLTGRPPFNTPKRTGGRNAYIRSLAEARRTASPPIDAGPPTARKVLQRTAARCLAPEKDDRYQSGEQLAAALDGCRQLAEFERTAPPAGSLVRSIARAPMWWAVLLIFLPQVLGSVVNIAYNRGQIVELLTPEQQALFPRLVTWYNVLVYPAAVATLVYFFTPVFRVWRQLAGHDRLDAGEVANARRAALRLPLWVLGAAAVGWLPGGVLFPVMLNWFTPTIDPHVYYHFAVSFAFSGLIAVAYSFCAMQYIAMRVLYPRMWTDATDFVATATRELAGTNWRVWFMLVAAYVVPIVANVLLAQLTVGGGGAAPLQLLVTCVSLLGLLGTLVVFVATQAMTKVKVALTGRS